jgi:molecular chaperone GrpE
MNENSVDNGLVDDIEMNHVDSHNDDIDDAEPSSLEEKGADHNLRSELDAAEARVLRAYADLDNYKKRFDREIARQLDGQRDKFIHSILGVADNLRRALRVENEESSPYRDGLLSVMRHIDNALADLGATQVLAEKGQQMDPNIHEAVTTLSVPGVEHGAIIDIAEPGYAVGDRVVRPAKVVVAKSDDE